MSYWSETWLTSINRWGRRNDLKGTKALSTNLDGIIYYGTSPELLKTTARREQNKWQGDWSLFAKGPKKKLHQGGYQLRRRRSLYWNVYNSEGHLYGFRLLVKGVGRRKKLWNYIGRMLNEPLQYYKKNYCKTSNVTASGKSHKTFLRLVQISTVSSKSRPNDKNKIRQVRDVFEKRGKKQQSSSFWNNVTPYIPW